MNCKERDKWQKAMIDEIDFLIKNGTWILVDRVPGFCGPSKGQKASQLQMAIQKEDSVS